ncbi:MAG: hypothetical protein HYX86_05805 [Chloroflexi bacterium]|nr:hypothetical protein [Chloroflexota bacterium]
MRKIWLFLSRLALNCFVFLLLACEGDLSELPRAKVVVRNISDEATALVSVKFEDNVGSALLAPGEALSVESVVGGPYRVAVVPAEGVQEYQQTLNQVRGELEAAVRKPGLTEQEAKTLWGSLILVQGQQQRLKQMGGGPGCTGSVKPGEEVTVGVQYNVPIEGQPGFWSC